MAASPKPNSPARALNVSRRVVPDEYSLVVREIEKDLLPAAQQYKLGLLPFLPLASGLLTGNTSAAPPRRGYNVRQGAGAARSLRHARNRIFVEQLQACAGARGQTMLELHSRGWRRGRR